MTPKDSLKMTADKFFIEWSRIWDVSISWSRSMSPNSRKKWFFPQNFDTKPSLELSQGFVGSRTPFYSMKNWLTKDSAPLNPSQIVWLFRKWYNRVPKKTKIAAYVISYDVIGHNVRRWSDISLERYGPILCVPKVIYRKNDSIRICRHFFESLSSLKFTKMRPKSRVPLRMVPLSRLKYFRIFHRLVSPSVFAIIVLDFSFNR